MPRLETVKNSNVFSWGEAYFELCSERPLGLRLPRKIRRDKRRASSHAIYQFPELEIYQFPELDAFAKKRG